MSDRDHLTPAPHLLKDGRQQGPPTRVVASDSGRSLRVMPEACVPHDARGSLPLTPLFNDKNGDGLAPSQNKAGMARDDVMIRIDAASWQHGYDTALSGMPSWLGRRNLAAEIDSWSWISGYIEGEAARQKRGSQGTSKLDTNREY